MHKIFKVLNIIKSKSWVSLRRSFYKLFGLSLILTLIEFVTLGLFALVFTGAKDGTIYNLVQYAGKYLSIDITTLNLLVCLVFAAAIRLFLILFFAILDIIKTPHITLRHLHYFSLHYDLT